MKYNKLNEELRIQKATAGHSAVNDHEAAEQRDRYNQLLQENKMLKTKIQVTESKVRFEVEQSLGDATRDRALLEAKNEQLEQRLLQLDARLVVQQDSNAQQIQ